MFDDVVEHVTRIGRAINQPRGNALLLGSQGLGRRSISRMASKLVGFPLFEINYNERYDLSAWRYDLKNVLMKVGLENKPLCLLVSDDQLNDEKMLEDINDVLNGEEFYDIYYQK